MGMWQVKNGDGKVVCTTTVPYTPQEVKELKAAGYKVKEVREVWETNTTRRK